VSRWCSRGSLAKKTYTRLLEREWREPCLKRVCENLNVMVSHMPMEADKRSLPLLATAPPSPPVRLSECPFCSSAPYWKKCARMVFPFAIVALRIQAYLCWWWGACVVLLENVMSRTGLCSQTFQAALGCGVLRQYPMDLVQNHCTDLKIW
jgi:hypothetical protein